MLIQFQIMRNLEFSEYDFLSDDPADKIIIDPSNEDSIRGYLEHLYEQDEECCAMARSMPEKIQTCFGDYKNATDYMSELDENKKIHIKNFMKCSPNISHEKTNLFNHIVSDEYPSKNNDPKYRAFMFDKNRIEDKKYDTDKSILEIQKLCKVRIAQIDAEIKKIKNKK